MDSAIAGFENTNQKINGTKIKLNPRRRHGSFESSASGASGGSGGSGFSNSSNISYDSIIDAQTNNKKHLSRNLAQHLHWKKKSNEANQLRRELEGKMQNEEWTKALQTCKKILDLQAFNFEPLYHFYCGFIYETGFHNYESAERHYRVALQLEQTNDKHIRYYARILRRLERYEQAEHVYDYGLDQHPDNHFIRYEYAYLLWLSQKYDGSIAQLNYCLEKDNQYLLSLQSKRSKPAHKKSRSRNLFRIGQQITEESTDPVSIIGENVYWLFGRLCTELEKYADAQKYFIKAIQLKPDDVGYRVDHILYLIQLKKYKDALKAYHEAYNIILSQYPEYKQQLLGNNVDQMIGNTSMLNINPSNLNDLRVPFDDTFAYVYLQSVYGYLLSSMKKYEKADVIFNSLIERNANDYYEIHFYYALHLHYGCKHYKQALQQYLRCLIIEYNWAITYYHLAIVLFNLDDNNSALAFLNRAFKMNPQIPQINTNFYGTMQKITKRLQWEGTQTEEDVHREAVVNYKKRNWDRACVLFLRLLDISKENTNYQHNLAMVLYYGFENDEASEKYFRKSLKSCGSSHPDIIRHYCVLLIKQCRWEEANAYYEILFKIINQYGNERVEHSKEQEKRFIRAIARQKEKLLQRGLLTSDIKNMSNDKFAVKYQIHKREMTVNLSMNLSSDDHVQYALVQKEGFHSYDKAKLHLKKALKLKPENGTIIGKYAMLLQRIRSFDLAKTYFESSLSILSRDGKKDNELRYQYASLLWLLQDYPGACAEIDKCLYAIASKYASAKQKPLRASVRMMHEEIEEKCCILYGIILIDLDQFREAKKYILKALNLNRQNNNGEVDPRYIAELMLLLIKTEQFDEAYDYYQLAIDLNDSMIDGDDWYLQCIYGTYCSHILEYMDAREIFETVIASEHNKISPCYFIHYYFALHLHYSERKYKEAEEQYVLAISIEDNWSITYYHYAIVLYELGFFKSSKVYLMQARDMNQSLPIINKNFSLNMKHIERAIKKQEKMYQKTGRTKGGPVEYEMKVNKKDEIPPPPPLPVNNVNNNKLKALDESPFSPTVSYPSKSSTEPTPNSPADVEYIDKPDPHISGLVSSSKRDIIAQDRHRSQRNLVNNQQQKVAVQSTVTDDYAVKNALGISKHTMRSRKNKKSGKKNSKSKKNKSRITNNDMYDGGRTRTRRKNNVSNTTTSGGSGILRSGSGSDSTAIYSGSGSDDSVNKGRRERMRDQSQRAFDQMHNRSSRRLMTSSRRLIAHTKDAIYGSNTGLTEALDMDDQHHRRVSSTNKKKKKSKKKKHIVENDEQSKKKKKNKRKRPKGDDKNDMYSQKYNQMYGIKQERTPKKKKKKKRSKKVEQKKIENNEQKKSKKKRNKKSNSSTIATIEQNSKPSKKAINKKRSSSKTKRSSGSGGIQPKTTYRGRGKDGSDSLSSTKYKSNQQTNNSSSSSSSSGDGDGSAGVRKKSTVDKKRRHKKSKKRKNTSSSGGSGPVIKNISHISSGPASAAITITSQLPIAHQLNKSVTKKKVKKNRSSSNEESNLYISQSTTKKSQFSARSKKNDRSNERPYKPQDQSSSHTSSKSQPASKYHHQQRFSNSTEEYEHAKAQAKRANTKHKIKKGQHNPYLPPHYQHQNQLPAQTRLQADKTSESSTMMEDSPSLSDNEGDYYTNSMDGDDDYMDGSQLQMLPPKLAHKQLVLQQKRSEKQRKEKIQQIKYQKEQQLKYGHVQQEQKQQYSHQQLVKPQRSENHNSYPSHNYSHVPAHHPSYQQNRNIGSNSSDSSARAHAVYYPHGGFATPNQQPLHENEDEDEFYSSSEEDDDDDDDDDGQQEQKRNVGSGGGKNVNYTRLGRKSNISNASSSSNYNGGGKKSRTSSYSNYGQATNSMTMMSASTSYSDDYVHSNGDVDGADEESDSRSSY